MFCEHLFICLELLFLSYMVFSDSAIFKECVLLLFTIMPDAHSRARAIQKGIHDGVPCIADALVPVFHGCIHLSDIFKCILIPCNLISQYGNDIKPARHGIGYPVSYPVKVSSTTDSSLLPEIHCLHRITAVHRLSVFYLYKTEDAGRIPGHQIYLTCSASEIFLQNPITMFHQKVCCDPFFICPHSAPVHRLFPSVLCSPGYLIQ